MAPFDVGDVVVCVDDRPGKHGIAPARIRKGATYRVEDISPLGRGVTLRGVDASPAWWFRADRFRKIDADTTEEFREQLRSLGKVRERTDA
jgi:hypothetical protein